MLDNLCGVQNKFCGVDGQLSFKLTINQLRRSWHDWRGKIVQQKIKPYDSVDEALKVTPRDLTSEDWHWFVKDHYSTPEFQVRNLLFPKV